MYKTGRKAFTLLLCFVSAFVFVTICSKNSFLYPMNDWGDENCFFTVGKAVREGKVLYRDIFEQKGPLVYFVFAIADFISSDSFLGVYLIELASFTAFLYMAYKCLCLFTEKHGTALLSIPFMAFAVSISTAFYHGGSVEELTLFCLCYGIYVFLRMAKGEVLSAPTHIFNGILLGVVFWVKYTIMGLFCGGFIYLLYLCLKQKNGREFLRTVLYTFMGFCLTTAPILFYFLSKNSVYHLWQGYFYNNIFVYSHGDFFLFKMAKVVAYAVVSLVINPTYSIPVVLGTALLIKRKHPLWKAVVCLEAFTVFGLFFGGQHYKYYGLPLCVFAVFGLAMGVDKLTECKAAVKKTVLTVLGMLPLVCYLLGPNAYLMKYEKEDLPQYAFAKTINTVDNPTLLNYGFLDGGFYFAAEVAPINKYFCKLNFENEEMKAEYDNIINNKIVDFIVCCDTPLEEDYPHAPYRVVEEKNYFFQGKQHTYYLYEKTE